jgi:hypothetical protein
MAIAKPLEPSEIELEGEDEIEVEIVNPEAVAIDTDDGGMIIDFEGGISEEIAPGHDANLAEFIDESTLQSMASELIEHFNAHKESRKERARADVKVLDLL